MIVTFLKPHLQYKQNEEADISESTALFLIRCRVATIKDSKDIDVTLTDKLKKTKKKK